MEGFFFKIKREDSQWEKIGKEHNDRLHNIKILCSQ